MDTGPAGVPAVTSHLPSTTKGADERHWRSLKKTVRSYPCPARAPTRTHTAGMCHRERLPRPRKEQLEVQTAAAWFFRCGQLAAKEETDFRSVRRPNVVRSHSGPTLVGATCAAKRPAYGLRAIQLRLSRCVAPGTKTTIGRSPFKPSQTRRTPQRPRGCAARSATAIQNLAHSRRRRQARCPRCPLAPQIDSVAASTGRLSTALENWTVSAFEE